MRVPTILLAALLLLPCLLVPAAGKLPPPAANHGGVRTDTVTLRDDQRNKNISVLVQFPAEGGPFPWIVFSHGEDTTPRDYLWLTQYWASQGYVVALPEHADSPALHPKADPLDQTVDRLTNPQAWANRVADTTLIIDDKILLESQVPALKGKINEHKLGVGGNSYGAFTAQMLAGAVLTVPGTDAISHRDDRPLAFLMLSPPGVGQQGLTEHSWDDMTRPAMSMTGTYDFDLERIPDWRMDGFRRSPAGDKYFVFLEDAYHQSFAGQVANARGDQKAVMRYIQALSLAFWDVYLKDKSDAGLMLQPQAVEKVSEGAARLYIK